MSDHRCLRQLGIALVLVGALGFGTRPAAARVPGGREGRLVQAEPGLFQRAWHWIAFVAASWGGLDPNGTPTTGGTTNSASASPTAATADNWGGLDPNG